MSTTDRVRTATALTLAIVLSLSGATPALADTKLKDPKLSFADASKPYEAEKYKEDGYVGKDGAVKNGGLGCSGYASAVLHRMRDGAIVPATYDLTVHQQYGDKIAGHFGLAKAATVDTASVVDASKIKALVDNGTLKAGGLYVFNTRKDAAGHVGFVRVSADGKLEQRHYSGISGYNGLATGDFAAWYKASQYKASGVELYVVPEKS